MLDCLEEQIKIGWVREVYIVLESLYVFYCHIDPQVTTLTAEADRLKEIHTNQAPEIEDKKKEISENWEKLKTKVE